MGADQGKLVKGGLRIVREAAVALGELPDHYEQDGVIYNVTGFTDDGRLRLEPVDGGETLVMDTAREVQEVIREGLENGVFSGVASKDANPNGIVLRAELIFEIWRILTGGKETPIGDSVGEDSYYRHAVAWAEYKFGHKLTGLYNGRDYEGSLTWMELHHLIYNVFTRTKYAGVDKPKGIDISVISTELADGRRRPEMDMAAYKQARWMKVYLDDIRSNRRCVPLPGYMAYRHGIERGIVPTNQGIGMTLGGGPGAPVVDVESNDWLLMEVRRYDLESLLPKISSYLEYHS